MLCVVPKVKGIDKSTFFIVLNAFLEQGLPKEAAELISA